MPDLTPDEELAEIQETNARFYRAVETQDLDAMEALWLHTGYVRCVHPGWCLLTGWESVRQSDPRIGWLRRASSRNGW